MLTRSWPRARPTAPLLLTALAVAATSVALVLLPPLFGLAALAGLVVTVAIVPQPRAGLYLLLLSIPVQDYGAVGQLTLTNVLFALTLVAWLLHRAIHRPPPLPRTIIGPLFTIFILGLTLSLTVARELGPGLATLFQWVKSLLVFFMALDLLRTRRQVLVALGALTLAGAAEGTMGLVQYATKAGPASFAIGADFSRAYGTFGRPNSYAGYLEMIFPLALALSYLLWRARSRHELPRLGGLVLAGLASLGALLIGGAIVASLSRGAWLGTATGLGVMTLLAGRRSRGVATVLLLAGLLFALVGGYSFLPATVQARFASIFGGADTADVRTAYVTAQNFSILERKAHWLAGLNMFASDWFLGVGLGNFNVRFAEFTVSPTFLVSQGHAHDYYIQVAAEAGLVGLSTYLLLLGGLVFTGFAALRSRAGAEPFTRALIVAAFGVIAAVAVHNIFEVLHVLSMGIQLSVVWALFTIARRNLAGDPTPTEYGSCA